MQDGVHELKNLRAELDEEKAKRQQAEESFAESEKKNQQTDAALADATKLHEAAAKVPALLSMPC